MKWSRPDVTGAPPSPRIGHSTTLVNTRIYVIGGSEGNTTFNDVTILNVDRMDWYKPDVMGPPPTARARHSVLQIQKRLFVFGGVGGGNDLFVLNMQDRDLEWRKLETKGTSPTARFGHAVARYGDKLYLYGGYGTRAYNDFFIFDTSNNKWAQPQVRGTPPTPGSLLFASFVGKRLFVVGTDEAHTLDVDAMDWQRVEMKGTPPQARSRHTATVVGQKVFVFGGVGGGKARSDLHVFDTDTCTWYEPQVTGTTHPGPRVGHAIVLVGTKLFLIGGHDGNRALNDTYVLDTAIVTWQRPVVLGISPEARVGHTVCHGADKVIIFGGASNGKPLNDVSSLVLSTQTWVKESLHGVSPPGLVNHTSTPVGSRMYVIGGSVRKDHGLWILSLNKMTWSQTRVQGRGPGVRVGHTATYVHKKIFVFGGYGGRGDYTNTLHVLMLDGPVIKWVLPRTAGAPPSPRVGHTAVAWGKRIIIFGGGNKGKAFNDVHIFDTEAMQWSSPKVGGAAPEPRFGHTSKFVTGKMYVFGGTPDGKRMLNDVYMLEVDSMRWSQPEVLGRPPTSRYRHAMALVGHALYTFGGVGGGNTMVVLDTEGIQAAEGKAAVDELVATRLPGASAVPAPVAFGSQRSMAMGVGGPSMAQMGSLSTYDVASWLRDLGFEKYASHFIRHEIDFDSLINCTDSDLQEIGIVNVGPRRKILTALEYLRAGGPPTAGGAGVGSVSPIPASPLLAGGGGGGATVLGGVHLPAGAQTYSAEGLYLHRYKVERTIAFGGASNVKTAIDIKTDRRVALKFVGNVEDFRREVRFLKELTSDFIVELKDFYEDPEQRQHCIIMDAGEVTLHDFVRREQVQRNERKYIFDRISQILYFLHSRNVVHCDLKPLNIMLFGTKWKLIDMETCRHAGDFVPTRFSPIYASPELAKAILNKEIDRIKAAPAMDMWSLGLIMYELFAREPLLQDKPDTLQQLANYYELDVPMGTVDDDQAQHLMLKLLVKHPLKRANAMAVLKHAYLSGGMDTQETMFRFEQMHEESQVLHTMLRDISHHISRSGFA